MNTIQIAAKLYEARDHMKMLWGDSWREKIEPVENAMRMEMQAADTDNSIVGLLNMCKRLQPTPEVQIVLMAAAVQISEPD